MNSNLAFLGLTQPLILHGTGEPTHVYEIPSMLLTHEALLNGIQAPYPYEDVRDVSGVLSIMHLVEPCRSWHCQLQNR